MGSVLLDRVSTDLIPFLREPPTVIDAAAYDDFDNGLVILRLVDLRVQISRERSELRVDIGTMRQPHVSFDDQILAGYLGLGRDKLIFESSDLSQSLRAIGRFLNTYCDTLSKIFDDAHFAGTKRELEALQSSRVERRLRPPARH